MIFGSIRHWTVALGALSLGCGTPAFAQGNVENDEAMPVAGPEAASAPAQAPVVSAPAPTNSSGGIVFQPGTGNGTAPPLPNGIAPQYRSAPVLARISCAEFYQAATRLQGDARALPVRFAINDGANPMQQGLASDPKRIDPMLLSTALSSYSRHNCINPQGSGPQQMVVVDFAKRSNEPRLYRIDLKTGDGADRPVLVAHGIGSDRNDDGYADGFSNINMSLMSSLGAVRGAEIYQGRSGRALRLDGLDPSNSMIRQRYIVVHSYKGDSRRYFNAGHMNERGNNPGTSEGCFVIEPEKRDWLIDTLANGGFLYAGVSGERGKQIMASQARPLAPAPALQPGQQIIFQPGTGTPAAPTTGTQP